jgi:hypothetical protein
VGQGVVRVELIGYWRSALEPGWPDPRDFVDATWDESEREAVATYLRRGGFEPWAQCGVSWCRFCGADNGSSERSDGVYLWPEGLAHYIRRHNVRLPATVIEHLLCALRSPDHDALRRIEADVRGSPRDVVIAKDFWARARLD